eukprot:6205246-Pleurochrysis_carterae.AAC.3
MMQFKSRASTRQLPHSTKTRGSITVIDWTQQLHISAAPRAISCARLESGGSRLLAVLLELDDELLDLGDAVRRRGERPRAASVVPAGGGGVESGERVRFGHARLVADQDLLLRALLRIQNWRRA